MAPIIADADALNIKASENIPFPKDVPVIITPHPGELSRLCKKSVKELAGDVIGTAVDYASENEVICVSKFARTVITNGTDIYINMSGGPSMSKGGSGDVLTGIIAGMLCCDLSPIDAAALAVFIHGSAGDITADRLGEYSPMARDIIDAIPEVLKMRGKV